MRLIPLARGLAGLGLILPLLSACGSPGPADAWPVNLTFAGGAPSGTVTQTLPATGAACFGESCAQSVCTGTRAASLHFWLSTFALSLGGKTWLLDLRARYFDGKGQYGQPKDTRGVSIGIRTPAGGLTGWRYQSGTFFVNPGLMSGSVDAIMGAATGISGATLHVSGSWTCADTPIPPHSVAASREDLALSGDLQATVTTTSSDPTGAGGAACTVAPRTFRMVMYAQPPGARGLEILTIDSDYHGPDTYTDSATALPVTVSVEPGLGNPDPRSWVNTVKSATDFDQVTLQVTDPKGLGGNLAADTTRLTSSAAGGGTGALHISGAWSCH